MTNILKIFRYLIDCMMNRKSFPCQLIVHSDETDSTIDPILKILRKGFHYDYVQHTLLLSQYDKSIAKYFERYVPDIKVESVYKPVILMEEKNEDFRNILITTRRR